MLGDTPRVSGVVKSGIDERRDAGDEKDEVQHEIERCLKPRTQAALDLVLYVVFFLPGIAALVYAGYFFAGDSWRIGEHSTVTAEGPPVYHFKTVIPIAGAFVMLQGIAEMVRCVVCLKTGEWPSRLRDVSEIDVVEEQLAHSEFVDEEARKIAIERAQRIDETARQRGMGGELNT